LKDRSKHGIWQFIRPGLWRAPDGREKCSASELRRRKNRLLNENPVCTACGRTFDDYRDVELSHKVSKGLGGSKHDDRILNLTLLHRNANRDQGSQDLETYLKEKWKPEICEL
jgi:5-methylcytosine-specific restriction endonuclease McrA